jgi:hypothetical protein
MTMRGEKVYECDFDVTGVTDFGIALEAILSGKEKIPPQGARIDGVCGYYQGPRHRIDTRGRLPGHTRRRPLRPGYKGDYRNY